MKKPNRKPARAAKKKAASPRRNHVPHLVLLTPGVWELVREVAIKAGTSRQKLIRAAIERAVLAKE